MFKQNDRVKIPYLANSSFFQTAQILDVIMFYYNYSFLNITIDVSHKVPCAKMRNLKKQKVKRIIILELEGNLLVACVARLIAVCNISYVRWA